MKRLRVLLAAVSLALASAVEGQGAGETLSPLDAEFYQVQAFQAARHEQRYALNHIGLMGRMEPTGYRVSAVLDGYPAHRAGLLRGDLIVEADGQPFHPVATFNDVSTLPDAAKPRSEPIRLLVRRDGQSLEFQITSVFENLFDSLRTASLNSIQQFASGNKLVGYVRFWALSRASNDLITYATLFAELALCDGIILDLRDATGFLSGQQLGLIYRGNDSPPAITPAEAAARLIASPGWQLSIPPYRNPVAILVNAQTSGGAELMAHQLGKLSRVVLIGESTAGRLGTHLWHGDDSSQRLHYQPDTDLTIDGLAPEGRGFMPEEVVDYPVHQQGRIDPQFQAAMDLLMGII